MSPSVRPGRSASVPSRARSGRRDFPRPTSGPRSGSGRCAPATHRQPEQAARQQQPGRRGGCRERAAGERDAPEGEVGAGAAGVYATNAWQQVEYVVCNADAKFLFAENEEQLDKWLHFREKAPVLKKVIVWDTEGLREAVQKALALDLPIQDWADEEGVDDEEIAARICKAADEHMAKKAVDFGHENMRQIEK